MSETETIDASSDEDNQKKSKWPFWLGGAVLILLIIFVPIVRKSGTVVDAETGEPIEGAVVLVEWTKTTGTIGLSSTRAEKIVETVTDKNGKFTIIGSFYRSTNTPRITIYMKKYVAWSSWIIFPTHKTREGFKWKKGTTFRLEKFQEEYSYLQHDTFVGSAAKLGEKAENKQTFISAFEGHERERMLQELRKPN